MRVGRGAPSADIAPCAPRPDVRPSRHGLARPLRGKAVAPAGHRQRPRWRLLLRGRAHAATDAIASGRQTRDRASSACDPSAATSARVVLQIRRAGVALRRIAGLRRGRQSETRRGLRRTDRRQVSAAAVERCDRSSLPLWPKGEPVAIGVRVRPRSHRLALDLLVRYPLDAGQPTKRGCVEGVLPAQLRGIKIGDWIGPPTRPKASGCRRVAVQVPPYEVPGVTHSRPPERGL